MSRFVKEVQKGFLATRGIDPKIHARKLSEKCKKKKQNKTKINKKEGEEMKAKSRKPENMLIWFRKQVSRS